MRRLPGWNGINRQRRNGEPDGSRKPKGTADTTPAPKRAGQLRTVAEMEGVRMTGAQITCAALEAEGADLVFGYPGGAVIPLYDAIPSLEPSPRAGAVRAVGGAGGRWLRSRHRQGRRLHGDVGPGRDEPGHRSGQRPARFGPGRRDHRASQPGADRPRRIPGDRHHRHHAADHQAQLPGPVGRRDRPDDQGGVLPGALRPARVRSWSTFQRTSSRKARSFICRHEINRRGYQPSLLPNTRQVRLAGEMINAAKKPLIMAGHGIMISGAEQEFERFVERTGIPVIFTLLGQGSLPGVAPARRSA